MVSDLCKLVQNGDRPRDRSGSLVDNGVDIVGNLKWLAVIDLEEADKGLNEDLSSFVLGERTPSHRSESHGLPEATDPATHDVVRRLAVARQEHRPIIGDAISLQSLQTAVDIGDERVVMLHHRTQDGFYLLVAIEDRLFIAPEAGKPFARHDWIRLGGDNDAGQIAVQLERRHCRLRCGRRAQKGQPGFQRHHATCCAVVCCAAQFHGNNSSMRLIGWSAMRPSTSRKYANGSIPFSFAVSIRV